jgi:hypothetical protein
MKTTFILIALSLTMGSAAQNTVAGFEELTLSPDTFYENHSSAPWQTVNATFRYEWNSGWNMWDGGFAYTNKNDSVNGTYGNLYGAITGKGYNNSGIYVTASQGFPESKMTIRLAPSEVAVPGFFVTNSTYAYKTMKNGSAFSRKFGDTLNTGSGLQPGDYPDWFKFTVYGYKNGQKKSDTVEFYLADFRFTDNSKDYILNTWEFVDCSGLGAVDSITFRLFSSDAGQFGINTPTYFCMDNFITTKNLITGAGIYSPAMNAQIFPNPFADRLNIKVAENTGEKVVFSILDVTGRTVHAGELSGERMSIHTEFLEKGIYTLLISADGTSSSKKIIKE